MGTIDLLSDQPTPQAQPAQPAEPETGTSRSRRPSRTQPLDPGPIDNPGQPSPTRSDRPAPDRPADLADLTESTPARPAANEPAPSEDWYYEQAIATVESLVNELEAGHLTLDEAFDRFSQAAAELKRCEDFLRDRQAQMDLAIEYLTD